jgi:hypothetical protein
LALFRLKESIMEPPYLSKPQPNNLHIENTLDYHANYPNTNHVLDTLLQRLQQDRYSPLAAGTSKNNSQQGQLETAEAYLTLELHRKSSGTHLFSLAKRTLH